MFQNTCLDDVHEGAKLIDNEHLWTLLFFGGILCG